VRRLAWIGLAVLVVAVAAVLAAVPVLIERNLSAEAVAARGTELLGREVSVDAVGVAFRPALRIRAEGVAVAGAGSLDAVEVELAWLPLLGRRLEPSDLHLRGPRLLLERGPEGGLRVRLLHPPGGAGADAGGGGFPALPAVEASDGEIRIVNPDGSPTGAPVLRIRDLELGRLRPGGRTPVALEVALDPGGTEGEGRFGVGELRLEGDLVLDGDAARITSGRLEGRDLLARGLDFPRFAGGFDYADGRVGIERLVLEGYGGEALVSGALRVGRPARFEGTLDASGLRLPDMIGDWRDRPLEVVPRTLEAHAALDVALRTDDPGTGRGTLHVREGELPAGSLFSVLLGGIGRLTGDVFSIGKRTAPAPSRVERITASVALRDGRLHSDDLVVVTDDYRFDAGGSLGLDRTLALSGTLALTSRGAQRMLASAALPLPGAGAGVPGIPLEVGGTLGSPRFTARMTALPGSAVAALTGLVRGGGGLVKGTVEAGGGLVKGAAETGGGLAKGAAEAGRGALDRVFGRGEAEEPAAEPPSREAP